MRYSAGSGPPAVPNKTNRDAGAITLQQFVERVARDRDLDFRGYKPTTLERRVKRRMQQLHLRDYREYLRYLRRDGREVAQLLNTVLINVTEFFRDPAAWEALRHVLKERLDALPHSGAFRVWTAGCSSGEEAYSVALLIADHFGARVRDYDIKVYATDIDDEALNIARRGEYPAERLRRVRPEWLQRYFTGRDPMRVARDVRRMVIFGRSNLIADAPISHVDLLVCRNVLIYFDPPTQRQILKRLHYALEPNGVLFLGKSESKLTSSLLFEPLNSRWRIFRKAPSAETQETLPPREKTQSPAGDEATRELLRTQQFLLDTLNAGVIVLDDKDLITMANDAALNVWGLGGTRVTGKRLHDTPFAGRCPELLDHLRHSRGSQRQMTFQARCKVDGEERALEVILRPMVSPGGERTGSLILTEDATHHDRLQTTVEQLEATSEELQSANEELETTNEELQSTNEELETTNEELQSTNEELETTNEELQSLNEELEHMNEELEKRGNELDQLSSRYAQTLQQMPWPVLLVDRQERIQVWNTAAQRVFGVGPTNITGISLGHLPVQEKLRTLLQQRVREALRRKDSSVVTGASFPSPAFPQPFDVHFTYMGGGEPAQVNVMIAFGPHQGDAKAPGAGRSNAPGRSATRKKKA